MWLYSAIMAGPLASLQPKADPGAEAMKTGLDAVEKAMLNPPFPNPVPAIIQEKLRAQEREALANSIAGRLWNDGLVGGDTFTKTEKAILAVLESCDDPGVYDRIPGEEGEDEAAPWDESAWPTQPADPRTERQRPTTPKADPAFPGEVTLRDDPAWRENPILREAASATRAANLCWVAGQTVYVLDTREGNLEARTAEGGEAGEDLSPWVVKAIEALFHSSNKSTEGPAGEARTAKETISPEEYRALYECDPRPAKPEAPDLLKAAEDVLEVYSVDETRDDGYCGTPALRNLRLAVEAEKKRRSGQVNAATALLSTLV